MGGPGKCLVFYFYVYIFHLILFCRNFIFRVKYYICCYELQADICRSYNQGRNASCGCGADGLLRQQSL